MTGTATELLKRLETYTEETTVKSRAWPKSTNSLSRQLNRLKSDLAAGGIAVITTRDGHGGTR
ncbi:hypothetical protein [Synechococcus sp. PCC 6312]|uniref:hypothetical protein n=1 Tax=Synechococcus sp. (strain ATCC 27167 / PCC 6312) TaxID=195253 RepID=UPI0002FFD8E5|nr:hypothetical protein [Synechococcus sp. PCC 6312]